MWIYVLFEKGKEASLHICWLLVDVLCGFSIRNQNPLYDFSCKAMCAAFLNIADLLSHYFAFVPCGCQNFTPVRITTRVQWQEYGKLP